MADEPDESADPLQEIMNQHLSRMQEIANEGFSHAKSACSDSLARLNRNVGLRDAVLDKTLTALGIAPGDKKQVSFPE